MPVCNSSSNKNRRKNIKNNVEKMILNSLLHDLQLFKHILYLKLKSKSNKLFDIFKLKPQKFMRKKSNK